VVVSLLPKVGRRGSAPRKGTKQETIEDSNDTRKSDPWNTAYYSLCYRENQPIPRASPKLCRSSGIEAVGGLSSCAKLDRDQRASVMPELRGGLQ
jgi:hypothetical protein